MTPLRAQVLTKLEVVRESKDGRTICWCPFHPDGQGKPPHQPDLYVGDHGFICHACKAQGSMRDLAKRLGVEQPDGNVYYEYHDEKGKPHRRVVRTPDKRFYQQKWAEATGWKPGVKGCRDLIYGLPKLQDQPDDKVFIVEGEKDCDRLAGFGILATTNPCGAGKWTDTHSAYLRGRQVVLIPDNDNPGKDHVEKVARSLNGVAQSIHVLELEGLGKGGDVSDWLGMGHTSHELLELAQSAPEWKPGVSELSEPPSVDRPDANSQADRLIALVIEAGTELFTDEQGLAVARFKVQDHRETWPVSSDPFKTWMAGEFYRVEQKAVRSESLGNARLVLDSQARYGGKQRPLQNRVALDEGAIWIDMGTPTWTAIRVDARGWERVDMPPPLFRRHSHQIALPEPEGGGDLNELFEYLNISDPVHRLLVRVYLVTCFIPDIPHPILNLHGCQGSAKTTAGRMLRSLVDPSILDILGTCVAKDLPQILAHHWMPVFDNVTQISQPMSDMLCRAATGDGITKRKHYSDDEDVIYRYRRCVGITGINVVAQRPDLLERSLFIHLDRIAAHVRKPETTLLAEFRAARPRLLGAALTILSKAMAIQPSLNLDELPRMADFGLWGYAIAEASGDGGGEFLRAYRENGKFGTEHAVEESPVAQALIHFVKQHGPWTGTPTELLCKLDWVAGTMKIDTRGSNWPKAANALSSELTVLSAALSERGVEYANNRSGGVRRITLNFVRRDDGYDDAV